MLSDSKIWENYYHFFKLIGSKANKESPRGFNPQGIIGDFEEAIRRGAKAAFPSAPYLGDSFHFMQANLRWWRGSVREREVPSELVEDLRELWNSISVKEFDSRSSRFLARWTLRNPPFAKYFKTTWLELYPPAMWARYGRREEFPSGDQILEGWHNRMQHYVCTKGKGRVTVDRFLWLLFNEWKRYEEIINNSALLQREIERIENEHNRRFSRKNAHETEVSSPLPQTRSIQLPLALPSSAEQTDSTATNETPKDRSDSRDASKSSRNSIHINALALRGTAKESSNNAPISRKRDRKEIDCSLTLRHGHKRARISNSCVKCHVMAGNKACNGKMCQACCSESPSHCSVTLHMEAKSRNHPRSFARALERSMQEEKLVYIAYSKGSTPGEYRPITPLSWLRKGVSFKAIDERTREERNYKVARIVDVSTEYISPHGSRAPSSMEESRTFHKK